MMAARGELSRPTRQTGSIAPPPLCRITSLLVSVAHARYAGYSTSN